MPLLIPTTLSCPSPVVREHILYSENTFCDATANPHHSVLSISCSKRTHSIFREHILWTLTPRKRNLTNAFPNQTHKCMVREHILYSENTFCDTTASIPKLN